MAAGTDMKHVFCVHSNITYLTSLAVINKEDIDNTKVVFLTFRGFKIQNTLYKSHKLKEMWSKDDNKNYVFYLKGAITWFLWYFYKFKFNTLSVYVPNSMIFSCYLFSKISLVKKYSYIDEGVLYYVKKDQLFDGEVKKNSLFFFFFDLILGVWKRKRYFLRGADNTYVYSERANKEFQNVNLLEFNPYLFKETKTINKYKKSLIVVIDGVSAFDIIKHYEYLDILETVLNFIVNHSNDRVVYYKFHPAYFYKNNNEANEIRSLFKRILSNQCNEELSSNENLESYINDDNVLFITGLSTLGFLCYLSNMVYISYLNLYVDKGLMKEQISSLPSDYVISSMKNCIKL
jgi:hypothetical protein